MSKKTIMLVCSAGMSTSMLVARMIKAAEARGIEADIFANAASEIEQKLTEKPIDVVLMGPQVRYLAGKIKETLSEPGIPSDIINVADYGTMNGDKVLDQALSLIKE